MLAIPIAIARVQKSPPCKHLQKTASTIPWGALGLSTRISISINSTAAEPKASPTSRLQERITSQVNLNLMLVPVRPFAEDQASDLASTGQQVTTLSIEFNLCMGTSLLVSVRARSLMELQLPGQPWYVEKVILRVSTELEVLGVRGHWRKRSVVSATPVATTIDPQAESPALMLHMGVRPALPHRKKFKAAGVCATFGK